MSYGEDIIATGQARLAREEHPDAKIVFGDPDLFTANNGENFKMHWSEMYENNPNILQPDEDAEDVIIIPNYPKHRPFINYKKTKFDSVTGDETNILKIAYDPDFELHRGELFFTEEELATAKKRIENVQPPIVFIDWKTEITNKSWILDRWQSVIDKSSLNFVEFKIPDGEQKLEGTELIEVRSFREACAILKICLGKGFLLGIQSNLHHAAAALNLPAIVIWSHYGHPDILGYDDHINVRWDAAGDPCGLRSPCANCKISMEMIKVDDVLLAIQTIKETI